MATKKKPMLNFAKAFAAAKKHDADCAEIKITLVHHGYQFDYAAYKGKKLLVNGSGCRDYPGDIIILDSISVIGAAVHGLGR